MNSNATSTKGIWKVISASSVGTLIEWYDFYIFGSLAIIISEKFFPAGNPSAAFLATLATFAAGFIVRPFGALVFGRLGDIVGRKYTFLLTLIIMGGSTFLIGLIPSYENFKLAPVVILLLRLIQGLALGGEYGGAATYVAEHAPENKKGFYTSFIQTTATLGLFISLIVIISLQNSMSKEAFADWGWRVPFLMSIALVIVSIIIRLKMNESPLFQKLKTEGNTSTNPLKESFGNKLNLKMVLLALFGATMGQGIVWYTSQFYAQTFLLKTCNIDSTQVNTWIGIALLLATPFFVFFGWLSDKIGRKSIMMTGLFLAIISYQYIFKQFFYYSDVSKKQTELIQVKPTITQKIITQNNQLKYVEVVENKQTIYTDGSTLIENKISRLNDTNANPTTKKTLVLSKEYRWKIIGWMFILVLFVTMVYGPIAAFLVELFPTKIRYTSMSLPYHIGNGVFGGMVPFIGTLIFEYSKTNTNPNGNPLSGLWYPIIVASICFVIGTIYLSNSKKAQ